MSGEHGGETVRATITRRKLDDQEPISYERNTKNAEKTQTSVYRCRAIIRNTVTHCESAQCWSAGWVRKIRKISQGG